MGYMHINNLYKDQRVLNFKRVYALEKIHGCCGYVYWNGRTIIYRSGLSEEEEFESLFDYELLKSRFEQNGYSGVTIYGEIYGGKLQGMRDVYGDKLRFVVFDVKSGGKWLNVIKAEEVARTLGLDFVSYNEIECTLESLDMERMSQSVQAIKNGKGELKWREGIVIRPLEEMTDNAGNRVIAKYKREDARETRRERTVEEQVRLDILKEAKEIAREWVTETRLQHVLDGIGGQISLEGMKTVVLAMINDVKREGEGEIEWSKDAEKYIGKATAVLFKKYLDERMREG